MKESALKEYVDRMGIVTRADLLKQIGVAQGQLVEPVRVLIDKKDVFYCRFAHGQKTVLSRHLLYCVRAVVSEQELSPDAQDIYDWLSEHEYIGLERIRAALPLGVREFEKAFKELQQKLYIAPGKVSRVFEEVPPDLEEPLEDNMAFLWVTDEFWQAGLHRAPRYQDFAYCLSELRRLLCHYFSTREIDRIIYHSAG